MFYPKVPQWSPLSPSLSRGPFLHTHYTKIRLHIILEVRITNLMFNTIHFLSYAKMLVSVLAT